MYGVNQGAMAMEPDTTPTAAQRRWAYLILALSSPALIIYVLVAARTDSSAPFLRHYGDLGLPLSLGCIAVLMIVGPRHPLVRWIWVCWILAFGIWVASLVTRITGGGW